MAMLWDTNLIFALILYLWMPALASPVVSSPNDLSARTPAGDSPASNITSPSVLNSSIFNYTTSKGLNGTDVDVCKQPPPWNHLEWTTSHWDCVIPPFSSFRNESEKLNALSDAEVFEFTHENLNISDVHTWYKAWSRERLNDPKFDPTNCDEVCSFARDFLPSRDFACTIAMAHCMHVPSKDEILRHVGPENRALAQRIYLQVHQWDLFHNLKRQQLDAFNQAWLDFGGKAFYIVKTFTKQADTGAVTGCEMIHKVVDLAVQIGLSMANGAASAVSNALTAKGSFFEVLAAVNVLDGKRFSNKGFGFKDVIDPKTGKAITNEMGKALQKFGTVMRDDWSDAAKLNWFGLLQGEFTGQINAMVAKVPNIKIKSSQTGNSEEDRQHLEPGMAADAMCSAFEGDHQDMNEANTHALNSAMSTWFSKVRGEVQSNYEKMYAGWIGRKGVGEPSMMAQQLAMLNWKYLNGPGSADHPLKNAAKYDDHVKSALLRKVLSMTMSDDGVYLYCMHTPDAQQQCNVDTEEKGKHYPWWWKAYRKTQICPRPKDDPELLCSAAHWYHASTMASHVTIMPGIDLMENFGKKDYSINVKGLLKEAYDTYERYGNDPSAIDWTNHTITSPVFQLPVCINDNLRLHDMNPAHKTWHAPKASHLQFPAMCGDWRGNASAAFMKALNLDPKSKIFNMVDGIWGSRHPNELFWDRIPRVLAEMNLTPLSHYLALCGNGVRLPEDQDKKWHDSVVITRFRPTNKQDQECGLIANAVENMTQAEGNEWFCDFNGRSHHTVFQRQMKVYHLPHTGWIPPAHLKQCHQWIKSQGKDNWAQFEQVNRIIDADDKEERERIKSEKEYLKTVTKEEEKQQAEKDKELENLIKAAIKEEEKERKEEFKAMAGLEQAFEEIKQEEEKAFAKYLKEMEKEEKMQQKEDAAFLKSAEAEAKRAHLDDEKRKKKEAKKGGI